MYESTLDDIMASMLAAASSESFEVVNHTGSNGETSYESAPPKALPPLDSDPSDPWSMVKVAVHKTVDIGNMESARIGVSLSVVCKRSLRESTFDHVAKVAWALLEREVAVVTKPDDDPPHWPVLNSPFDSNHPRVAFGAEYGLTINMGDYQFTKPTVGSQDVCDPHSFTKSWESLTKFLGNKIKKHVKAAKTGVVELGL